MPSPAQEAILRRWEHSLRFLWNLAHGQRSYGFGRPHGERVFPSFEDQCKELTQIRAEYDWIKDVSSNAQQAVLKNLHDAWMDFFHGKKGKPSFKSKEREPVSIHEKAVGNWSIEVVNGQPKLQFAKVGKVPVIMHRPIPGQRVTATILRDVDQWFVLVVSRQMIGKPAPSQGPVVAIDRGIVNVVSDSQGVIVPRPPCLREGAAKINTLQRRLKKKKPGSKNREKARIKVAKAYRKVRRQREHMNHVLSSVYAKNHSVIVLEDLDVQRMTKAAIGPGRAQKRGLSRSIGEMGWGHFARLLEQKSVVTGAKVVEVRAAYSSQTCAACGNVDSGSRRSQDLFHCVSCGHEANADTNAACVLRQRYLEDANTRRAGGEEVCGGDEYVRPARQKPKAARPRTPGVKKSGKPPKKTPGDDATGRRARADRRT